MNAGASIKSAAHLNSGDQKRVRQIVTPEGIAIPVTIASRSARFGALVLDLILVIVALIAFSMLLDFISGGVAGSVGEETIGNVVAASEFLSIGGIIFAFFGWYGYFLIQELGPRGATFGKRAVGIRVAARKGGRLTPEAIIARNLLRDVEVFYPLVYLIVVLVLSLIGELSGALIWAAVAWFLLFAFFPYFNKDALRAGDIIAGTWVIETPKTKLADAISTQGAAAQGSSDVTGARYDFGERELSVYGEHELQTLERMLREGNDEALLAVHATICRKIGWDPGEGDERAFLEAFYAQLRSRLENDLRFGKRKADKHS